MRMSKELEGLYNKWKNHKYFMGAYDPHLEFEGFTVTKKFGEKPWEFATLSWRLTFNIDEKFYLIDFQVDPSDEDGILPVDDYYWDSLEEINDDFKEKGIEFSFEDVRKTKEEADAVLEEVLATLEGYIQNGGTDWSKYLSPTELEDS